MKKYDEYKDSGVAWIGDVPKHWKVIKTSLAFQGIGSGTTPSTSKKEYYDDNGNGKYWLQTGDLEDGIIYDTSKKVSNIAIKECNLTFYPIDSIIIAMYGATIGKVGILGIESATNQACCVIPVTKKQIAKYFFYEFLACKPALLIAAIGGGQPNISQDTIKKLKIVIPPIIEQAAIATYLDTHCAKIDNLISIQQKRIALLQELKQSVITHAVTKGLNPNVQMKRSGVEWIGDVPKHWEYCRFKDFMLLQTTASNSNKKIGLENIESRSGKFVYTGSEFEGNGIAFSNQDIIYGKLRPYLQKVWLATFDGNAVGDFFVFRMKSNSCPSFVKYLMLSDGYTKETDGSTIGAKMPRVSSDFILTMHYCLPPITEQAAIASYLDHKCATIDTSISNAQHQIDLLQEYKQSLITEVVTGKRKVTDN